MSARYCVRVYDQFGRLIWTPSYEPKEYQQAADTAAEAKIRFPDQRITVQIIKIEVVYTFTTTCELTNR